VAERAAGLLSQDSVRTPLLWWDGKRWENGTQQFVYSYPSIHFIMNLYNGDGPVSVLYRNHNVTLTGAGLGIYDDNASLLWNHNNYSDIPSDNTKIVPVVVGPLQRQTWSESSKVISLPIVTSPSPLEQLHLTNDETMYLWYRRNITLQQASTNIIITVDTRMANAFLFFLDGQYLGEFDDHQHLQGTAECVVAFDLSHFKPNQDYLFEILPISLGLDNGAGAGYYDKKRYRWKCMV
jgi:hypothetical protein